MEGAKGPVRVIAIDWSGAKAGGHETIWIAEVVGGELQVLENGRSREQVVEWLAGRRAMSSEMVVGLDFAFSFPEWFLLQSGLDSAPALWTVGRDEGERWLRECDPPFWGRPGKGRPTGQAGFRRADSEVPPVSGISPKSVFQIGGAGAVGTGSIRGMVSLPALREQGFSIWPFDDPRFPVVVEIYPRALTGAVAKSSEKGRRVYLARHYPGLPAWAHTKGESSEDAFDALVSALIMHRHVEELVSLPAARDERDRREGRIWVPQARGSEGEATRARLWGSS